MKAGQFDEDRPHEVSVRPLSQEEVTGADSDADDEGIIGFGVGEEADRIALEKDDAPVRRLLDPKLPAQDEVDRHWLSGHIPYRNWCSVCVKSSGKELDHSQDPGKDRRLPSITWNIVFQVMSSGSNGRFLYPRKGCPSPGWRRRFL